MKLARCYFSNGTAGYADPDRCEFVLLFRLAARTAPPAEEAELGALFPLWLAAPLSSSGLPQRSLLFFNRIQDEPLKTAGKFAKLGDEPDLWDRCVYWRSAVPGAFHSVFPGSSFPVSVRQWYVPATRVATLKDLVLTLRDESDIVLTRKLGSWPVRDAARELGNCTQATLSLRPRAESVAGAISFALPGKSFDLLPVELRYNRAQEALEGNFEISTLVEGRPFGPILGATDNDEIQLALDPRDGEVESDQSYSYAEFPAGARLATNFLTDQGLPVHVKIGADPTRAHVRLLHKVQSGIIDNGDWRPDRAPEASFVPVGDFTVDGFAGTPAGRTKGRAEFRLLMGASPTEHVAFAIGDTFRFEALRAGVLGIEASDPRPKLAGASAAMAEAAGGMMHDGGGLITTSWLTVVRKGTDSVLVSEATVSPVFGRLDSKTKAAAPTRLDRSNVPCGRVSAGAPSKVDPSVFLPAIPWAGVGRQFSGGAGLEATHLGPARRLLVRPDVAGPTKSRVSTKGAAQFGITPQGLLCKFIDSDFRQLYFGSPDPKGSFEFSVRLEPGPPAESEQRKVYQELQRAVRAEDLFLVVRNPSPEALRALVPVGTRDDGYNGTGFGEFSFPMALEGKDAPVLLIKYFRHRSLADLVAQPATWGCARHLARADDGSADLNQVSRDIAGKRAKLPHEASAEAKRAWFDRVWNEPEWQGVVLLDARPGADMPDLFKALSVGMGEPENFRIHHLGLDAMPVRSGDLPGNAQEPKRAGAAFALVLYSGDKGPKITPADYEPEEATQPTPKYSFKTTRLELLIVKNRIAKFEASADVAFDRLFREQRTPSGDGKDHVITLTGVYERRGATDVFSLTAAKEHKCEFRKSWLKSFSISNAELSVTQADGDRVAFFVGFTGILEFNPVEGLGDIIGLQKVRLERAGLEFDSQPNATRRGAARARPLARTTTCRFRADSVRVELEPDTGARKWLLSVLPLKLTGFRMTLPNAEKLLDFGDLGFTRFFGSGGANNDKFDFGLDLEIDFGSLGRLMGLGQMKVPALLGWTKGQKGFGFGVQFPLFQGEVNIGFSQFLAIRAKKGKLERCPAMGTPNAFALTLSQARLVLFGREMPSESQLSVAVIVRTEGPRRVAWLFGRKDDSSWLRYIGVGQGVNLPAGTSAKKIVGSAQEYLFLEPGQEKNICAILPNIGESDPTGWTAVGEFNVAKAVHAWFAVADEQQVYALRLELPGELFTLDAAYRRLDEKLGVFAGEIPIGRAGGRIQMGAATIRLPNIRVEVYTDGGWLIDVGFPWNNDFRRSFQLELGIFLGSGGFYYGRTSALAVEQLALQERVGEYEVPNAEQKAALAKRRAIRAGIALRVGIGRSIDLGVLKGEASITLFGALEGAATYDGDSNEPGLLFIRGTVGILVHVWAELDFVVLQARAEIKAWAQVEFEVRRVLAVKGGTVGSLTLPTVLAAEVGIQVRFEVWVTIGCIKIKLFDLSFSATFRFETTIGGLEWNAGGAALQPSGRARDLWRPPAAVWPAALLSRAAEKEKIRLYVMMLPCAADPADVDPPGAPADRPRPCMVGQYALGAEEGFTQLTKFLLAVALEADDTTLLTLAYVKERWELLKKASSWSEHWSRLVLDAVVNRFEPEAVVDPGEWPKAWTPGTPVKGPMVSVPAWPGVSWRFVDAIPRPPTAIMLAQGRGVRAAQAALTGDPVTNVFVDFLRLAVMTMLDEAERALRVDLGGADTTFGTLWGFLSGTSSKAKGSRAKGRSKPPAP